MIATIMTKLKTWFDPACHYELDVANFDAMAEELRYAWLPTFSGAAIGAEIVRRKRYGSSSEAARRAGNRAAAVE
jgi:hypothetical protein